MAAAITSTRTMLPLRRAGSPPAAGSARAGWPSWSVSALIGRGVAYLSWLRRADARLLSASTGPGCASGCSARWRPIRRFAACSGRASSCRPSRQAAFEAHDVTDHLGDRLIVLVRDFLVDLDGGVEATRQRHVLDDRDVVLAGDLADLQRNRIDALGDADRR